jgi:phosphoribosyl 1,2-cyclic phosphodiesterase
MLNAKKERFLVHFWGVRGSYPTPGAHTLRHGGNTSCVEVQVGGHHFIFDAGSGIIRLGEELMQKHSEGTLNLALFITHAHGDHLSGFPFFAPLFDPRTHLHLFGPKLANMNIEQLVTPLMSPPYFPVDVRKLPSHRTFHTVVDDQCISWSKSSAEPALEDNHKGQGNTPDAEEVRVLTKFSNSHPLNGSIVYRVEYYKRSLVYATDLEWGDGCDDEFLRFIEGADVLIHDAQYTTRDYQQEKRGFGHSTLEMATEAARDGHVHELILFHHEPTYSDSQLDAMETAARKSFKRTISAYEGMNIDLFSIKN